MDFERTLLMIINDNVDAFSANKSQEHGLKELLEKVVSEIEEKKPSVPRPISAFQFCCIEIWGSNWRKKNGDPNVGVAARFSPVWGLMVV